MKYPTSEQVMAWLKRNGWQCVREYDFAADFEKEQIHAFVNVPLYTHMFCFPRRLDHALVRIAIAEGRSYIKLRKEMAAL